MKARMKPKRVLTEKHEDDEGLMKKSLKLDKIARKWAGRSAPNMKKIRQKENNDKGYTT